MSDAKRELVSWFETLRVTDIPSVGGKNASLGEMINAGLPVPPGFAITAYSYEKFINETHIVDKIYEVINDVITDKNDPKLYDTASKRIRELIEKTPIPKEIETAIRSSLQRNKQTSQPQRFFCSSTVKRHRRRPPRRLIRGATGNLPEHPRRRRPHGQSPQVLV